MELFRSFFSKLGFFEYLLIYLCLFHFIANIIWIGLDNAPPPWDQAGHTIISYKFTDYFQAIGDQDFLKISDYYPPFLHLLASFGMLIFGKSIDLPPIIVTLFFINSLVFLYLYIKEIFKDRLAAFIGTLFYSLLPAIFGISRYFLLDIPLISMVVTSMYFLEKSQNFQIRKSVYLFSIFASLAIFIKWVALIYLFAPVALKIFSGFKSKNLGRLIKNILISLGIILLVNSFWYFTNTNSILQASQITTTAEESDPKFILSFENFKYYIHLMTNFQLTWVGMIVFLLSLIIYVKKEKLKSFKILAPFLFIYMVFTFIGNKDLRYIVILAPLSAIVVGYAFSQIIRKKSFPIFINNSELVLKTYGTQIIGSLFLLFIVFYYLFYYFSLSFGFPIAPKYNVRKTIFVPFYGGIDLINLAKDSSSFLAATFDSSKWPNGSIVEELSKFAPNSETKILLIIEKPQLNQVNMELARRQLGKNKIEFLAPYSLNSLKNNADLEQYLNKYDLVLIADKDLGPQGGIRHISIMRQLKKYIEENHSGIARKINKYPLPDGDNLSVYKINKWPNSVITEELSKFNSSKNIKILTAFNKIGFNQSTLEKSRVELGKKQIKFIPLDPEVIFTDLTEIESFLKNFDVILVSDKANNRGDNIEQINEFLKSDQSSILQKINTYYLPDDDTISVYKFKEEERSE